MGLRLNPARRTVLGIHRCLETYIQKVVELDSYPPKLSILYRHISSLHSCRKTHSCTQHQTSSDHYISYIVYEHMREEGIRLFPESKPEKKEAVSLNPISGIQVSRKRSGFTKPVTPHLRSLGPKVQRHMAYFPRTTPPNPYLPLQTRTRHKPLDRPKLGIAGPDVS